MIHGNGFTLYGLLANREVDRTLIWKRLEQGEFDIIFIGNIWRQFGQFSQVAKSISRCPRPTKLAILDGDDDPRLFPYSTARIRDFGTCANHLGKLGNTELFYFKRELNLDECQSWIEHLIPHSWRQTLRKYLGARQFYFRQCSFSIPQQWIRSPHSKNKKKRFATHIVDREVAEYFQEGTSGYAFETEREYFDDLSSARYGITTKRSGWDCLRHYEIAAAGCVPCFRQLDRKPSNAAPHGMNASNCIIYESASDLEQKISAIDEQTYNGMLNSSHQWVLDHTTDKEAIRILRDIMSPKNDTSAV